MIHDELHHADFHQVYNIIVAGIFIQNLSKRLTQYIIHCLQYLSCQTVWHYFYRVLQSVVESSISFHTVTVNFIVDLLKTKEEFNAVMTVTCKFLKKVKFISEKNTWTTAEWAKVFFNSTTDWSISVVWIGNRDFKWFSQFWTQLFTDMSTKILMTMTHHS